MLDMKLKYVTKKSVYLTLLTFSILLAGGGLWSIKLMNGVPQEIGVPDMSYSGLNQQACKRCHGPSLANKHHVTKKAVSGDCTGCHKVNKGEALGVVVERNCVKCHKRSAHHQTEAAKSNQCIQCHKDAGVSAYNLKDVPAYKPTKVTPTKDNCKNCHVEAKVAGNEIHDIKKTHHETKLKCGVCHENDKNSQSIRVCARCHNAKTLHGIKPHADPKNCRGCHVL